MFWGAEEDEELRESVFGCAVVFGGEISYAAYAQTHRQRHPSLRPASYRATDSQVKRDMLG